MTIKVNLHIISGILCPVFYAPYSSYLQFETQTFVFHNLTTFIISTILFLFYKN